MMRCALVVLAAVLFFCSFHTCATSEDIHKESLLKLNMRSNKLQEALTASDEGFTVDVTVTGTGSVTVTVTVKGTNPAVTFTGTGRGTLAGDTPVEVTIAAPSSGNTGKTVTGKISVSGTFTGANTFTGTSTLTGAAAKSVSLTGDITGSISVTGDISSASTVTVSGSVEIAKTSQVVLPPPREAGSGVGTPGTPNTAGGSATAVVTSTTTEAPEPITTSTAAPTEAPQKATEKPTNPTEGKPDSSNSRAALHVALFIGSIALLSVV